MPSATIAHAAVIAMPTMNPTGVRPGARVDRRPLGGWPAWLGHGPKLTVRDRRPTVAKVRNRRANWSRPDGLHGLDQQYGEPCGNGPPRAVPWCGGGIGSKTWHGAPGGLRLPASRRALQMFPPEAADAIK